MQQAMCGSLPNTYIPDSVPSPSNDSHQFRLGCGSQPCLALSILVIIVSVATRPAETFAQSANGLIVRTVLGAQQASVAGATAHVAGELKTSQTTRTNENGDFILRRR